MYELFQDKIWINIPLNVGKATSDENLVVSPMPIINSDSEVIAGVQMNMR